MLALSGVERILIISHAVRTQIQAVRDK